MGNKPRMESKGNNNNSNDSMEAQNRNGLMCCSVPAARGCCFGVISLRTGVRLVAASLLLVSVLSLVATAVWILANEHARQHLMGYICAELALVMCYVYGLYIALSYVKALWQDSTTMNGAVVALESVTVHTCQVPAEQNNVVHVMATPVQGHIAQGSPSKILNTKKHGPSPWAASVKPARLVGAMWK